MKGVHVSTAKLYAKIKQREIKVNNSQKDLCHSTLLLEIIIANTM